jgi:LysM repeat protein
MTDRGQSSPDVSPACPFVAFDHDRDARADRPDHRHRCFAESEPAPRALAHQEAYCLSSAFPVCPTFQAWARREAAEAKASDERAAASAAAMAAAGEDAGQGVDPASGGRVDDPPDRATEWTAPPSEPDEPLETMPRRNPPRDWAAPPPWATGAGAGAMSAGIGDASTGHDQPVPSPSSSHAPPRPVSPPPPEGQGLAGSAADRLASGQSISPPIRPTPASDIPSSGPDAELAGLVGAAAYPPARAGRRPTVSSSRSGGRDRAHPPERERVQAAGPAWEQSRRYEAYPTIKEGSAFGRVPALPRIAVLAGALGIAALALFFLPALIGIGGGEGGASPSPSTAVATPTPSPTPEPLPTPQTYVIKSGDTLSKIATKFDVTVDQLLEANKDTITNPDRISVGDEIIIPVPVPEEVPGASAEDEPPPE